jgi:hypothetical protein
MVANTDTDVARVSGVGDGPGVGVVVIVGVSVSVLVAVGTSVGVTGDSSGETGCPHPALSTPMMMRAATRAWRMLS